MTVEMAVRWVRIVVFGAMALGVVACGGGGTETATSGEPAASGDGSALATIEVISTDVAAGKGSGGQFSPASSGDVLAVGDQVKTDPSGFAEVGYFDGSWMRIENDNILTMVELAPGEQGDVVHTSMDGGRAWARVQKLTESGDKFELDTPVAQATVRGTAFAVYCPTDDACTFTVTDGIVTVTLPDGTQIEVTKDHALTVTKDQAPGEPVAVTQADLDQDPWIAKNQELDRAKSGEAPTTEGTEPTVDLAAGADVPCALSAILAGAYSGTLTDIPGTLSTRPSPGIPAGLYTYMFDAGSATTPVSVTMSLDPTGANTNQTGLLFGKPDQSGMNDNQFTNVGYDTEGEPVISGSFVVTADGSVTANGIMLTDDTMTRTIEASYSVRCGAAPTGTPTVSLTASAAPTPPPIPGGQSVPSEPDPYAPLPSDPGLDQPVPTDPSSGGGGGVMGGIDS